MNEVGDYAKSIWDLWASQAHSSPPSSDSPWPKLSEGHDQLRTDETQVEQVCARRGGENEKQFSYWEKRGSLATASITC